MSLQKASVKTAKVVNVKSKIFKSIIVNRTKNVNFVPKVAIEGLIKNRLPARNIFSEEKLYESVKGDFLVGDSPMKVILSNRIYLITKFKLTIAKCIDQGNNKVIYERTSDKVSKLIGQEKFNTLLTALGLVENQEIKIRAIMALLTDTKLVDKECQTNMVSAMESKSCQTNETSMNMISKFKQRRRIKRAGLTPYVIKDIPNKDFVDPSNYKKVFGDNDKKSTTSSKTSELPVLQITAMGFDDSCGSTSNFSLRSDYNSEKLLDPREILNNISQHTEIQQPKKVDNFNPTYIKLLDGSLIMVPVKPEDDHHIATPEILKNCTNEEKNKLLWQQLFLDFKLCMTRDEDDNLPIHNAVMSKDVEWLRRQCIVLKKREESLDIMAGNQTALQMSIIQDTLECTRTLLLHGADPLFTDEEYHRHALHFAAERSNDQLKAIVNHCMWNAREILENDELWKPELEGKSKEELGNYLLKKMCETVDNQGYTPLMLASKIGNYTNVRTLLEASRDSVNVGMPTSGNTALFLAVEEACLDAVNRGAKQRAADHFQQTISLLLENGANSEAENHVGINIHLLISEHNNAELSMLIANKINKFKYFNGQEDLSKKCGDIMLVKDEQGNHVVADLKKNDNKAGGLKKVVVEVKKKPEVTEYDRMKKEGILKDLYEGTKARDIAKQILDGSVNVKKDKPVILENITVDKNLLRDMRLNQVKMLKPSDKLVYFPPIIKNVKHPIANVKKGLMCAGRLYQSANFSAESKPNIIEFKTEAMKRKSFVNLGAGPSDKKRKSDGV